MMFRAAGFRLHVHGRSRPKADSVLAPLIQSPGVLLLSTTLTAEKRDDVSHAVHGMAAARRGAQARNRA